VFAIFRTLLVIAFLCWTTQTVVVDAEELVQRATMAERLHRTTASETTGARFVPIGLGESYTVVGDFRAAVASGSVASATPLALASAYMASPFGARVSLSMEAVAAFRAANAGIIQDRVISYEREGLLLLSMTVSAGELRGVELTMNAETHDVLREVLVFPRIGRVEIERLSHAVPAYVPSRRPPPATVIAARLPGGDTLDKAELKARLVLVQSGVDMKGEIRVSRTPAAVRVESGSVPPDQQGRIASRLTAIDHVQVDFRATGLAGTSPPPFDVPGGARFGLRHWLARNFRDPGTRSSFLPKLLHSLTTVHQRIGLLAELARRYPDPPSQLSTSTRPMLQQLVDQHYRRLRTELNESRVWVAPLSGAVTVITDTPETPTLLVSQAPRALSQVTALEQLVYTSLRKNDLATTDQQRINSQFGDLWETIHGPLARAVIANPTVRGTLPTVP
jgi:hypothetical protein